MHSKSNTVVASWWHSLHQSLESASPLNSLFLNILLCVCFSVWFFSFPLLKWDDVHCRFLTQYLKKWELSHLNEEMCLHCALYNFTPCSWVFLGNSNSPPICHAHTAEVFDFSCQRCISLHLTISPAQEHLIIDIISCFLTSNRAALRWH